MTYIQKAITTALLILLSGCAVPYQPAGANGGYSHKRLGNDRFVVTFEAPQVGFDEQRLRDYCLLRCAEVTKEYKFEHFTIERDDFDVASDPIGLSGISSTKGTSKEKDGTVEYEETTHSNSQVHSIYRTEIAYEIRCYEEPPTQGNFSKVYDADDTILDIRYKYGMIDEDTPLVGAE